MKKLVLATNNSGKLTEIQQLLAQHAITVVPQRDFGVGAVAEDGLSFVENAIIKARHACQQTGLPALADDSGLLIDALQGKPGIYSARFAGEHASDAENIAKALTLLADSTQREAHFFCVMVLLHHAEDPAPLICQGRWHGRILTQPAGEHGFGYDPIFYVPTHDCSAAQLPLVTKNQISHRAQALQQLVAAIKPQVQQPNA